MANGWNSLFRYSLPEFTPEPEYQSYDFGEEDYSRFIPSAPVPRPSRNNWTPQYYEPPPTRTARSNVGRNSWDDFFAPREEPAPVTVTKSGTRNIPIYKAPKDETDWRAIYEEGQRPKPGLIQRGVEKGLEYYDKAFTPFSQFEREAEQVEQRRQGLSKMLGGAMSPLTGGKYAGEVLSYLDPRYFGFKAGEMLAGSPGSALGTILGGGSAGLARAGLTKAGTTAAKLARGAGWVGAGAGLARGAQAAEELGKTGGESGWQQLGGAALETAMGVYGARLPRPKPITALVPTTPVPRPSSPPPEPRLLTSPERGLATVPPPKRPGRVFTAPERWPEPEGFIEGEIVTPEPRRLGAAPEPTPNERMMYDSVTGEYVDISEPKAPTVGPPKPKAVFYDTVEGGFVEEGSKEIKRIPITQRRDRLVEVEPEIAARQFSTGGGPVRIGGQYVREGRWIPESGYREQVGAPTEIRMRAHPSRIGAPITEEILQAPQETIRTPRFGGFPVEERIPAPGPIPAPEAGPIPTPKPFTGDITDRLRETLGRVQRGEVGIDPEEVAKARKIARDYAGSQHAASLTDEQVIEYADAVSPGALKPETVNPRPAPFQENLPVMGESLSDFQRRTGLGPEEARELFSSGRYQTEAPRMGRRQQFGGQFRTTAEERAPGTPGPIPGGLPPVPPINIPVPPRAVPGGGGIPPRVPPSGGPPTGGNIPRPGTYPTSEEAVPQAQPAWQQLVNLPRGMMAAWDLSAPLRQGLGLIHKKAFRKSLMPMLRSWASEEGFQASENAIRQRDLFKTYVDNTGRIQPSFAEQAGLQLGDLTNFSKREEQIMSKMAETLRIEGGPGIPGISKAYEATYGRGVKASNRAYTAFLNNLRAGTFEELMEKGNKLAPGSAKANPELAKAYASFVNAASGRGSLGSLEKHAAALNSTLFSPRLVAARLQMLNPVYYYNAPPAVRLEALKSLAATATFGTTLAAAASRIPGVEVSTDPSSTDFGKIKIGKVRVDPWGGYQQYAVAANRLLNPLGPATGFKGETPFTRGQMVTSSESGVERSLWKEKPGPFDPTPLSELGKFGLSKSHPALGFAIQLIRGGKEVTGKEMDFSTLNPMENAIAQRFIPLLLQDMYELYNEDPSLIPILGPPAALGMGVQTHSEIEERKPGRFR